MNPFLPFIFSIASLHLQTIPLLDDIGEDFTITLIESGGILPPFRSPEDGGNCFEIETTQITLTSMTREVRCSSTSTSKPNQVVYRKTSNWTASQMLQVLSSFKFGDLFSINSLETAPSTVTDDWQFRILVTSKGRTKELKSLKHNSRLPQALSAMLAQIDALKPSDQKE